MPKIKSPAPPSSVPSAEESPSSPSTPKALVQESDGGEVTPSRAEATLIFGEKAPPGTQGAFLVPPNQGIAGGSPISEGVTDAALLDEVFSLGAGSMSGEGILRTIKVIAAMEAVIIRSLVRQLKSPKRKTKAKRGLLSRVFDPKPQKTVPGPGNKPRTVEVQLMEDHIPSVQERYLSDEEKAELRALLKDLPQFIPEEHSDQKRSEFHGRITRILYQVKVPLHELRELLPIKETGSLVPLSRDATTKPDSEFTPVVSKELLDKARELGLVPPE